MKTIAKKSLRIDLGREGLLTVFKEYEAATMELLWEDQATEEKKGYGSGRMWETLQAMPDEKVHKSRASVIFFLNRLVDWDICDYDDRTGKGGHHRIYHIKMTREEFWKWLALATVELLVEASDIPAEELFDGYKFFVFKQEDKVTPPIDLKVEG